MPRRENIDFPTRRRIAHWLFLKMQDRRDDAGRPMTQEAMSKLLGIHNATVSRVLKIYTTGEDNAVGLDLVIAMVRKLPMDANELLGGTPRPTRGLRPKP